MDSNPPEGNVKVAEVETAKLEVEVTSAGLNATQGSLLGFLHNGPRTGWDLLQEVEGGLSRFWNITSSHVYRELRTLEARRLIKAGAPGTRDRRPFTITAAGKRAFRAWISQPPGPEQMRFPLLVTLWFGRHLDRDTLAAFLDAGRREHDERLRLYRAVADRVPRDDPHTAAVVGFGLAYEQAVLEWLDDLRATPPARSSGDRPRRSAPPVAVAVSFIECINRRDLHRLARLLADDHGLHVFDEPPLVGRQANIEAWRSYFRSFPDYTIYPHAIAEREGAVAVLGHTTGSHLGLADAEERRLTLIWVAVAAHGELRSWGLVEDNRENRQRLGL
jgi:DNA-binding PadR family transcriptional regulator